MRALNSQRLRQEMFLDILYQDTTVEREGFNTPSDFSRSVVREPYEILSCGEHALVAGHSKWRHGHHRFNR